MIASSDHSGQPEKVPPARESTESRRAASDEAPERGRGLLPRILIALLLVLLVLVVGGSYWYNRPAEPLSPPSAQTTLPSAPERDDSHPLDPALKLAYEGLESMQARVDDYTARIVKRERSGDELHEQTMLAKIRNRKVDDEGNVTTPFAVYLKFLEPSGVKGREVIWVEGANEGKLIAHEAGFRNLIRAKLDPSGILAMMGNRYPISFIGLENLVSQLIEKGERDRKRDEVEVRIEEGVEWSGLTTTLIEVVHPEPRPYFDFHIARIWIDQERKIPVRYAAYQWPEQPGGEPVLDEEYSYHDIQLNVGLDQDDFDPDNPEYNYP